MVLSLGFGTPKVFFSSGSNLEKECSTATAHYPYSDPGWGGYCDRSVRQKNIDAICLTFEEFSILFLRFRSVSLDVYLTACQIHQCQSALVMLLQLQFYLSHYVCTVKTQGVKSWNQLVCNCLHVNLAKVFKECILS